MPGRKSKRSISRKRVSRKRRALPVAFNPLPDRLHVKLRYTQNFIFTTTTAASVQIMRGNSLFDPDYTGTGHQPLFRDQYSGLYNRYCVLGSSIACEAVCPYANQCMQVVLYPQPDDVTTGSTIPLDSEKPRAKSMIVTGGGQSRVLRHKIRTGTLYSTKLTPYSRDDVYCSQYGTNPSSTWYWVMSAQNPDLTTSSACTLTCTVVYDVVLFDPLRQTQS